MRGALSLLLLSTLIGCDGSEPSRRRTHPDSLDSGNVYSSQGPFILPDERTLLFENGRAIVHPMRSRMIPGQIELRDANGSIRSRDEFEPICGPGCIIAGFEHARCWSLVDRDVHCDVDGSPEQHRFDRSVVELAHFSAVVCARLSTGDVHCAKLWQRVYMDEAFRIHELPTPTPRQWPLVATGVRRIVSLTEQVGMIVGEGRQLALISLGDPVGDEPLRVERLPLEGVTELLSDGLLHCAVRASEVHCWGEGAHYLGVGPLGYDPATLPSAMIVPAPRHVLDLQPGEELQLLGEILCVRRRGRDLRCDRGVRDTVLPDYWEIGELPEGSRVWRPPPPPPPEPGSHRMPRMEQ